MQLAAFPATVVALALVGSASAGQDIDIGQFEGRWVAQGVTTGFFDPASAFDLVRCGADDRHLCGLEVRPDGSCGGDAMLLRPRGGGYADGSYTIEHPETDRDLDQSEEDWRLRVEALVDGERLTLRVHPSASFVLMSRHSLDDMVIEYRRSGPPACTATS